MDTQLSFQELLIGNPFQGADILSGWMGKENTFIDVHTQLTTCKQPALLVLRASNDILFSLPEILQQDYVQGILLHLEETIHVPADILAKTAHIPKPILFLKSTNFNIMLQAIDEMRQLKNLGMFQYVWEQSNKYWLNLLNESSITDSLHRLEILIGNPVVLLDSQFYVHPSTRQNLLADAFTFLKHAYNSQAIQSKELYTFLQENDDYFLLFKIETPKSRYGWLLIKQEWGSITDITIELVLQLVPSLVAWFVKEDAISETNRRYENQFIYDVLYNNFESEELLITYGSFWGWDFTKPAQLMVMQLAPTQEQFVESELIESVKLQIKSFFKSRSLQAIVSNFHEQLIMIVFDTRKNSKQERKESMNFLAVNVQQIVSDKFPELDNSIGLGRFYQSKMELFRSFQEAKIALEMGKFQQQKKHVFHFEDIGVIRLLSHINNEILSDFYIENLGELADYDKANEGVLIKTLQVFFQENGDIGHTADALFIHPNTLRNRLKKIESLLHINLNSYEDLLNLFVTLKISQILK